jgi:hypothetical protein
VLGGMIFYPDYTEIITQGGKLFEELRKTCVSTSLLIPKAGDAIVQQVFKVEGELYWSTMAISGQVFQRITKDFRSNQSFLLHYLC